MSTSRLPVLFCAHGNPMNALGTTPFAAFLRRWGAALPRPQAIVVVSAHWEAPFLAVTAAPRPATIRDFWGFPPELYALDYPAPGAPELAGRIRDLLVAAGFDGSLDRMRGLDHGAWAPLRMLFPAADVPVVQLSLLERVPGDDLLAVGRALQGLREDGVLLLGSGNLVHNLDDADLSAVETPVPGWATAFDSWVGERLAAWDLTSLAAYRAVAPDASRAHPTEEHYLPLLVACGAAGAAPRVGFPFTGFEHGAISLRCVQLE